MPWPRGFPAARYPRSGPDQPASEVLRCLLAVACAVGGAGSSPERAEAVGGLLEPDLELGQGSCGLPHLKQQFRQQFAERIEAILHRHVLEATIFVVGGCPHE